MKKLLFYSLISIECTAMLAIRYQHFLMDGSFEIGDNYFVLFLIIALIISNILVARETKK